MLHYFDICGSVCFARLLGDRWWVNMGLLSVFCGVTGLGCASLALWLAGGRRRFAFTKRGEAPTVIADVTKFC